MTCVMYRINNLKLSQIENTGSSNEKIHLLDMYMYDFPFETLQ
jgi:hypothetical protein